MSARRVTKNELRQAAATVGLGVQFDCGGCRIVYHDSPCYTYVFPPQGVCPTVTKREAMMFLQGVKWARYNRTA